MSKTGSAAMQAGTKVDTMHITAKRKGRPIGTNGRKKRATPNKGKAEIREFDATRRWFGGKGE